MKKSMVFIFATAMAIGLTLHSCKKDNTPVSIDCTTVTYAGTIKALVSNNCSSSTCHGSGSSNGDYTSYDKIKNVATNGKMKTQVIDQKTMPQGSTLTDIEIAQVKCWLDDGAPNN